MVKHQPVNVENNALWLICMYTYLRNIGHPFLYGVFLFSKVWVLIANFDGLFAPAYSSHILWSWPLGRVWYHRTFLSSNLYLKGHQLCPTFCFLRKRIMEPILLHVFGLPPSLIMSHKCSNWVLFEDEIVIKGLTRSCFHA
jgi:hypothetical protein